MDVLFEVRAACQRMDGTVQAWLVAFDDADGNRLRLYTLETHGPAIGAEEDNPWVKD